jgi:hypothetical protein
MIKISQIDLKTANIAKLIGSIFCEKASKYLKQGLDSLMGDIKISYIAAVSQARQGAAKQFPGV